MSERLGQPARIVVLRALQLGDLLCSVPALRALRTAAPHATITLIGLPWAREFVARFSAYLDDFIELPGWPGLPERPLDLAAVPSFLAEAQSRRFDLAVQLHGSGGIVNELTVLLGARASAGFYVPGQWCPDAERFIAWPDRVHEIHRYLMLTEHLGARLQDDRLEFPLTARDRAELAASLAECAPNEGAAAIVPRRYIVVHPGSQLPSRRWAPQRFAQVADALAAQGLQVVLTGTAAERSLTDAVAAGMRAPCINLAGRTTLGAVAALIEGARLLVCNDTGVSHIAAALTTPSVVVCSGADPHRWAPIDTQRHRVLAHPVPCRPCAYVTCPVIGHPCAEGTTVDAVVAEARALLRATESPTAYCPPDASPEDRALACARGSIERFAQGIDRAE